MDLKRGIEKAVSVIVDEIRKMSRPVSGNMVAQVGMISANGDQAIGTIIAEAMDKVGRDGVITVEEASWRPRSTSSRACSSTAATCLHIS